MQDFPEYVGYYAIKNYRYEGAPDTNDYNRNLLLFRDPSVDGLKTGFTDAAGYCMVATARRNFPNLAQPGAPAGSAEATGGRRLLSIVLGAASENARANESQKLLNWGYTAFEAVKLFDANQPVASPAVWKGRDATVKLGRPQMIVVSVPAGSAAKIKTNIARPDPLVAPLSKGQAIATLKVSLADQPLTEVPLVVLEDIPQAGVLGRAWDAIRLWIR
jgi:D-alanyl-D-alanine carboxypeptidase (penicillin-binding protein 5/6)